MEYGTPGQTPNQQNGTGEGKVFIAGNQYTPQKPNEKINFKTASIVLSAVVLLLAGTLIFALTRSKNDTTQNSKNESTQNDENNDSQDNLSNDDAEITTPPSTPNDDNSNEEKPNDETDGWLNATSYYGLSFRYPSDWLLTGSEQSGRHIITVTSRSGNRVTLIEGTSGLGGACDGRIDEINFKYFGESGINGVKVLSLNGGNPYLSAWNISGDKHESIECFALRYDWALSGNSNNPNYISGLKADTTSFRSFGPSSNENATINGADYDTVVKILKSARVN